MRKYTPSDRLTELPHELTARRAWVCWRLEERDGKPTKTPYTPATGQRAKSNDPDTWADFATAYGHAGEYDGLGIMFDAGLCGVDLDHCRDPETGEVEPWARKIVAELDSYTETSPSGAGLHVLLLATLPDGGRRNGRLEMYDSGRYFTVTGEHVEGTPSTVADRQAELTALHRRTFGDAPTKTPPAVTRPAGPVTLADAELQAKALAASNGAEFARLWAGGYPEDDSAGDLALCNHLAFWTSGDRERVDTLFRQSQRMRDKWDEKRGTETYGERTIGKALEGQTEFYAPGAPPLDDADAPPAGTEPMPRDPEQQAALPGLFKLTDMGNAERFASQHAENVRYCFPWAKWLTWDGKHWTDNTTGNLDTRAKATVRTIYAETAGSVNDTKRKALGNHARRSESAQRLAAMLSLARSEPGIPVLPDELDRDPWLLNVANGTIDLRTGELQEHRRGDLLTKLVPVNYNPEASCPMWELFLRQIMGEQPDATNREREQVDSLVTFLQRAVGYSLTGDTREQVLIVLHGNGSNGKSTFLELVKDLLTDYAMQTPASTFLSKQGDQIPNDVARLKGARFVCAVETDEGRRLAEAMVKQMTGSDTIAARFLRAEWFEFKPEFKVWLAANHRPVIKGTDHAIWRRIRLIPFNVRFVNRKEDPEATGPQADSTLSSTLQSELPGILAWAVRGCLDWQRNGLGTPEPVRQATAGYRAEMDVLARFLTECCVEGPRYEVSAKSMRAVYTDWCQETGERLETQTRFGSRLSERGIERERNGKGATVYQGIGLKSEGSE